MLALLGPNGAGKTTTIEICEGFRRADSGTVRVLGLDPAARRRALRPRVGVMLQDGVGGYTAATRAASCCACSPRYAAHPHDPATLLDARRADRGRRHRRSSGCPAASSSGCRWRWRSSAGRNWCSSTSRRRAWTRRRAARPGSSSASCAPTASASCSPPTSSTRPSSSPTTSSSSTTAGSSPQGSPAELTRAGAEGQIRFRATPGLRVDRCWRRCRPGTGAEEASPGRYLVAGDVTPQLLATLTAWCAGQGVLAEDLAVERRTLEDVFLDLTGRELRA